MLKLLTDQIMIGEANTAKLKAIQANTQDLKQIQ